MAVRRKVITFFGSKYDGQLGASYIRENLPGLKVKVESTDSFRGRINYTIDIYYNQNDAEAKSKFGLLERNFQNHLQGAPLTVGGKTYYRSRNQFKDKKEAKSFRKSIVNSGVKVGKVKKTSQSSKDQGYNSEVHFSYTDDKKSQIDSAVNSLSGNSMSLSNSSPNNSSSGNASGPASSQFLWKPISEGDGNLVVLLPPSNAPETLSITDASGNVIETASRSNAFDDGRIIYRFDRPGSEYPSNVSVAGYSISNPAQRFVSSGGGEAFGSGTSPADAIQNLATFLSLGPEAITGQIPEIADFEKVSPEDAMQAAIDAALNTIDSATEASSRVDTAVTQQALDRLEQIAPGSSSIFGDLARQAASMSRGEIPQDVADQVMGRRAERSSMLGLQGGDSQITARDLGLTSLDLINQGQSTFERIISAAQGIDPVERQTTVKGFQLDPTTILASEVQQAQILQDTEQARLNAAAAPDPVTRALFQLTTGENAITGLPNPLTYNPLTQGPFEQTQLNQAIQGLTGTNPS